MNIINEHHEPGWGEHDFVLASSPDMPVAANALSSAGYMVGGGADNGPHRVTISLDSGGYKNDVETARGIIEAL